MIASWRPTREMRAGSVDNFTWWVHSGWLIKEIVIMPGHLSRPETNLLRCLFINKLSIFAVMDKRFIAIFHLAMLWLIVAINLFNFLLSQRVSVLVSSTSPRFYVIVIMSCHYPNWYPHRVFKSALYISNSSREMVGGGRLTCKSV